MNFRHATCRCRHLDGSLQRIIDERRDAQSIAAQAKPVAEHRRPTLEEADKGSVTTFIADGRDAEYLTARIARDRPDILDKMKAGVSIRA